MTLRTPVPGAPESPVRSERGAIAQVFAAEGAKAGVPGFMRSAAIEFARHNVTINALLPGNIMTGSLEDIGEEWRADLARIGFCRVTRTQVAELHAREVSAPASL